MKIIASDYDGTLNFNGIDDKKRQAIEAWRSAGNLFVLVSGRHASNVRQLHLEQQFGCDFFVGSNGAVIRNDKNEVVHADCCDLEQLVPLIRYLFELGCPYGLVHAEDHWFYTYPSAELTDRGPACTLETMPEIKYYTQVTTWLPTEAEAAAIAQKVRQRFGKFFNPLPNGTSLDIVRADANKASGLHHLMALVGADHGDIITVGDNINDSDMIREFRSYAMESGVQSIKELADFVTPGVTELIERELALQNGMILHNYRIPAEGVSKKVIYHFSDVHLSVHDAFSTLEETGKAEEASAGWVGTRSWFAKKYGEPDTPEQRKRADAHFSALLELAQTGDALVMAGDICEYVSPANLRFLDSELGKLTIPWLAVCGNHDKAEDISDGYLFSQVKQDVQTLDLEDLILIGIDNSGRSVTAAQNEQLRTALALGKPTIVVMHVPIMTEGNRELLLDCGEYFRLNHPDADENTKEFIEILRQNTSQITAVLAGHLHFLNESEITPGLTQYVSSQGILGNINRYEIGI